MNAAEVTRAVQFLLAGSVSVVLFAVGIWDGIAIWKSRPDLTVTAVVQDWASRCPICLVVIGIVLGHLFWPSHLGK
jgi:hypothetical protein